MGRIAKILLENVARKAAKEMEILMENHPDPIVRRVAWELNCAYRMVYEATTWTTVKAKDLENTSRLIRKDLGIE